MTAAIPDGEGMNPPSEFETVYCPGCGGSKAFLISEVLCSPVMMQTRLVGCDGCALAYISPRPGFEIESRFYEKEYFERANLVECREHRLDLFRRSLRMLAPRTQKRRILDAGCGAGFFLEMAEKQGWDAKGIDLSKEAVQFACEKLHLDVIRTELKLAPYADASFDVITLWNVLDQMRDPGEQCTKAFRLLAPGGVLALRISNLSFHIKLHHFYRRLKRWGWIRQDSPEPAVFHLCMFSPGSIREFLEARGFKNIQIYNSILDRHSRALKDLFGEKMTNFLTRLIYEGSRLLRVLTFGKTILCPSMIVFARKPRG